MTKRHIEDRSLLSSNSLLPWYGVPEEIVVYIHSFIDTRKTTTTLLKLLRVSKFYFRLLAIPLTTVFDTLSKEIYKSDITEPFHQLFTYLPLKVRMDARRAMCPILENKERRQDAVFLSEILSMRVLGECVAYYRQYPFTDSFYLREPMERFFFYDKEASTCIPLTEMKIFKKIANMPKDYFVVQILRKLIIESDQIEVIHKETLLFLSSCYRQFFAQIAFETLGNKVIYENPTPETPVGELFCQVESSSSSSSFEDDHKYSNIFYHDSLRNVLLPQIFMCQKKLKRNELERAFRLHHHPEADIFKALKRILPDFNNLS